MKKHRIMGNIVLNCQPKWGWDQGWFILYLFAGLTSAGTPLLILWAGCIQCWRKQLSGLVPPLIDVTSQFLTQG